MMKNSPSTKVRGPDAALAVGSTPGDRRHLSISGWTPERPGTLSDPPTH